MCLRHDPETGQGADGDASLVAASADDSLARAYEVFVQETRSLDEAVLLQDAVDLSQVMLLIDTTVPSAGTTEVILIGNPASLTEVSPSAP